MHTQSTRQLGIDVTPEIMGRRTQRGRQQLRLIDQLGNSLVISYYSVDEKLGRSSRAPNRRKLMSSILSLLKVLPPFRVLGSYWCGTVDEIDIHSF